jgi:hypothetical protein
LAFIQAPQRVAYLIEMRFEVLSLLSFVLRPERDGPQCANGNNGKAANRNEGNKCPSRPREPKAVAWMDHGAMVHCGEGSARC